MEEVPNLPMRESNSEAHKYEQGRLYGNWEIEKLLLFLLHFDA